MQIKNVGLKSSDVENRIAQEGFNSIGDFQKKSALARIRKIFREPMFMLLILAAAVYIAVGDLGEGITLAFFVLAVLGLTLYQEGKSENSIEALKDLNQPFARVFRDGNVVSIPTKNIVREDIILISEGDRISADGNLIEADNLEVDESLLTGESLSVLKNFQSDRTQETLVYSGTFVIRGQGLFKVSATGIHTEIGKIGHSLSRIQAEETPLHKQTARLVKVIASIGLALCAMMIIVLGLRTGEWVPALLSGIALAMAMLPEEYPVVLAIFPALGAHRLAKQGVLVRHIDAIETLGATTILCTDKTGTLTQNQMTVQALVIQKTESMQLYKFSAVDNTALPNAFHSLIKNSILASIPIPFDPMEIAFHRFGEKWLGNLMSTQCDWELVKTYPLNPELRAMSQVWKVSNDGGFVIAAKGSPEAVFDLCHMSAEEVDIWKNAVDELALQGLRVLAVAEVQQVSSHWPNNLHDLPFKCLGLIALSDPIRNEVPHAMAECHAAGIRVIMITGDYPATAQVIAKQAGMSPGLTITGDTLDQLSDHDLENKLKATTVCARISPHQKLRIIEALKRNGEIVTMTGDGVNDAPALLSAHVGVAMGMRGTDVAREAADLVLVDDNFASIVRGIRTGRRIFSNLQKSMAYIFAIHIPIALLALIPMIFALPPLFLPLHIALLEMIIDPACSLAFENEPEDPLCMAQAPRNTDAALFGAPAMLRACIQGIWVLIAAISSYWTSASVLGENNSVDGARTMVMVSFVVANGFLIFISKSEGRNFWPTSKTINRPAIGIALGTLTMVLCAIYFPWIAIHLRFYPLDIEPLFTAIACGGIGFIANLIFRTIKGINLYAQNA